MTALSIEDLEQQPEQVELLTEAPKQCRISLSADAPHSLKLEWNPGGRNGRTTTIVLQPGKSCVQPLARAEVWLGPFTVPQRYAAARDERERAALKEFWREERARVLNRYDYPRPVNHLKDGIEPIGRHRFPDVTVTVIDAEGVETPPLRLHQLYKVGEFDELYPPGRFGETESIDEVKARYEAQLADANTRHEAELTDLRKQVAEVQGFMRAFRQGATK